VPVRVLKHCMRKFSDSRLSSPDGGSGLEFAADASLVACGSPLSGFKRAVIAWTLNPKRRRDKRSVVCASVEMKVKLKDHLPVEGSGQDEVVICADLVQAVVEVFVVN
jgi:hypothetical protein